MALCFQLFRLAKVVLFVVFCQNRKLKLKAAFQNKNTKKLVSEDLKSVFLVNETFSKYFKLEKSNEAALNKFYRASECDWKLLKQKFPEE